MRITSYSSARLSVRLSLLVGTTGFGQISGSTDPLHKKGCCEGSSAHGFPPSRSGPGNQSFRQVNGHVTGCDELLVISQSFLPIGNSLGLRLDNRSRVNREVHIRFWESARVKIPRATHLFRIVIRKIFRIPSLP